MADADQNAGGSELESIDSIVRSFLERWEDTESYLVNNWHRCRHSHSIILLSFLIKVDLQERFRRGQRPTAGRYFENFPELIGEDERALSLVYEEFCLLEEHNAQPDVDEFCARYEQWRDSLVSQLGYHREFSLAVGQARPKVAYPLVGERFATYELCSILGQGGAAQVYLATDGQLGGRKVVLKISSSIGLEPSILAHLDHRNIIPILTVAESPESGLRGICMPYRPGRTLESVLATLTGAGLPKKASPIWELLELSKLDPELTEVGWQGYPLRGTYTEAVAWLGVAISNALVYLHEKQIYHRDIKPANILLAHREGPLLFDFNLAHTPNAPEYAQAALNGGTLPYMAPEQLRAFLDPAMWDQVGAAADIYAFGLVLRELVTGVKPETPNPDLSPSRAIQDMHDRRHAMVCSVKQIKPDTPPSLDAIISKCLAFKAVDRYDSAKEVGEDLKRFLKRRPLVIAPNHSRVELTLNWIYRQHELAGGVLSLLLICVVLIALSQLTSRPTKPLRPTQFSAPSYDEFRRGVKLLNSENPLQWVEARSIFESLRKQYKQSAWPILYLADSYNQLKVDGASELVKIACEQPDAEEAIQQRILEDPQQVNLLVALGFFYQIHDNKNRSVDCYQKAYSLRPDHVGAIQGLAFFAQQKRQYTTAIEMYQKLIRLLSDCPEPKQERLNQARELLLPVMIHEVDRLLAEIPEQPHWQRVQTLLDEVGNHLTILRSDDKLKEKFVETEQAIQEQKKELARKVAAFGRAEKHDP